MQYRLGNIDAFQVGLEDRERVCVCVCARRMGGVFSLAVVSRAQYRLGNIDTFQVG